MLNNDYIKPCVWTWNLEKTGDSDRSVSDFARPDCEQNVRPERASVATERGEGV